MHRIGTTEISRALLVAGLLGFACSVPHQGTERRRVNYYEPTRALATVAEPDEVNPATVSRLAPVEEGCGESPGQLFGPGAPWNTPVAKAPLAVDSAVVVQFLDEHHQSSQRFRTDFSFVVLEAKSSEPLRPFTPNDGHYVPDCDTDPMPVPAGGRIEGEDAFQCAHDGDCHLLVRVPETCQLYEMYRANISNAGFSGGCQAHWDTRMTFGLAGRGFDCTSADASGLPITPLLFSPSDVASGRISHALRLILPNALIRQRVYVPPATHSTSPTTGPLEAPPYGARFRLRPDYDTSALSAGARVVAQALKEYGMIVVDGGNVSFTTISDRQSPVKWDTVGFGARSLESLKWTDFQMIKPAAPPRAWRGMCERVPGTTTSAP